MNYPLDRFIFMQLLEDPALPSLISDSSYSILPQQPNTVKAPNPPNNVQASLYNSRRLLVEAVSASWPKFR